MYHALECSDGMELIESASILEKRKDTVADRDVSK